MNGNRRTKVAVLASWYPNSHEPLAGIFVQEQAEILSNRFDVAVIALEYSRFFKRMLLGLNSSHGPRREGNITVLRKQWGNPFPFAPKGSAYESCRRAIAKDYRRLEEAWGKPDVLHAHVTLPAGYVAVLLGRSIGVPVVITEHSGPFAGQITGLASRKLLRETLVACDRVLAVSPSLSAEMGESIPGLKADVVGNLVLTEQFVPSASPAVNSPQQKKTKFFSLGLMVPQKGFSYLLDACKLLKERGRNDFELEIGGDGALRQGLEAQAVRLGIGSCCRFLGRVSREQAVKLMQGCDVFVLPSIHESFGIVSAEAMACGKPVLSTRCGGPEFVVTPECGILVSPARSDELADAMEGFILEKFRFDSTKIRESAVIRFGEAAFLQKMSAIYNSVISIRS